MKFRIIVAVLTLAILGLFGMVMYLTYELRSTNKVLKSSNEEVRQAKLKLIKQDSIAQKKLQDCLNDGTRNSWEIAAGTNTLTAYSSFKDNCNSAESDCHKDDLKNAIDALLNTKGYVQMVETNGNQLFTTVNLSLDGDFVKFKTDKSVRTGAIGIPDCGSANSARSGVLVKDEIVRVRNKCNAPGSKSVWALIEYAD